MRKLLCLVALLALALAGCVPLDSQSSKPGGKAAGKSTCPNCASEKK